MSSLITQILAEKPLLSFIGSPGPQEMLIVGIIALLLFGKRLPEVARNLGKGFSEFKKGMSGFQDEFRNASREADRTLNYTPPATPSTRPTTENRPAPSTTTVPVDDEFAAPRFDLD